MSNPIGSDYATHDRDYLDKRVDPWKNRSLLASAHHFRLEEERKRQLNPNAELEALEAQEKEILKSIKLSHATALKSANEIVRGVKYTTRLHSTWTPPKKIAKLSQDEASSLREQFFIDVTGSDIPPPILSFREMRFPNSLLDALKKKGISRPTQIQMQGLPVILSGRDMIGISFTGSGKTIVFALPAILFAYESERTRPYQPGEGPFALILSPSRELSHQISQIVNHYSSALSNELSLKLRNVCCIGGVSMSEQKRDIEQSCHIVIGTPGRVLDLVQKKILPLSQCMYLALDEVDRMLSMEFEESVRSIISKINHQKQMVLFSATLPKNLQDFSETALLDPIIVNVGRAGCANLDVIQEIEYVTMEERLVRTLVALQKTPPPVLIFCQSKVDVDGINEYLLIKGIDSAPLHSGLSQEDRLQNIQAFRDGKLDVLVGTDVASKGLDFDEIKHVINYDMPKDIEHYIHRIGRTGRGGHTGIATTFIDNGTDKILLLDLLALLKESKQYIPSFLNSFFAQNNTLPDAVINGIKGCAYCGGLGHRITHCNKLQQHSTTMQQKHQGSSHQYSAGKSYFNEM